MREHYEQELAAKGYYQIMMMEDGKYIATKQNAEDLKTLPTWTLREHLQKLSPYTRVLSVYGTKDKITSLKHAENCANYSPNHTLRFIEGADHDFTSFHEQVVDIVLNFLTIPLARTPSWHLVMADRVIPVPGTKNFRDIGGYFTKYGGRVRSRYIFRSDIGFYRTDEDVASVLRRLNIRKIFDLRYFPEIEAIPPKDFGIERVEIPVFSGKDFSPEATRWKLYARGVTGYVDAYMSILEHGKMGFSKVFRHILADEDSTQPFLLHCTMGKDRTGVLTMLLHLLAGIHEDDVCQDYSLTGILYKLSDEGVDNFMRGRGKILENREQVRELLGSKPESMRMTLYKFYEVYGNVDAYVMSCGFERHEVKILRQCLQVFPLHASL